MVGEKEYGKGPERNREFQKISRQILHARSVAFRHPITSAAVKILAPAPADFSAACAAASIRLPGNPASD
jgi:23S rRNA-/tRNA-specific pseudouridylate synthase